MSITKRAVNVLHVPVELTPMAELEVLRRIQMTIENSNHSRFVLDCSNLKTIGSAEIDFLLGCLEDVMKYNGDLRLAGLSPVAQFELSKMGVSHLFETFPSTEHAIYSYQVRPMSMAPLNYASEEFISDSKFAA